MGEGGECALSRTEVLAYSDNRTYGSLALLSMVLAYFNLAMIARKMYDSDRQTHISLKYQCEYSTLLGAGKFEEVM